MIWEILQMITGGLLFGCVFALIVSFAGMMAILTDPYSTHGKKRNVLVVFIGVIIFTTINLVVFSTATVNVKYLEKEQVTCVHKCECPECCKILEAHDEEGKQ